MRVAHESPFVVVWGIRGTGLAGVRVSACLSISAANVRKYRLPNFVGEAPKPDG